MSGSATIGLYVPGASALHRCPAGVKLAALLLAGIGVLLLERPWQLGVALVLVLLGFGVARVHARLVLRQLRPLWLLLAVTFGLHVLLSGWSRALMVTGAIAVLVLLAGLVTCTTRLTALVAVVETVAAPLRRLGVSTERLGLVVALGLRCVAVVAGLAAELRDAQRARGLRPGVQTLAAPLVVRSLRHADRLAEALAARGLDD